MTTGWIVTNVVLATVVGVVVAVPAVLIPLRLDREMRRPVPGTRPVRRPVASRRRPSDGQQRQAA
jgi:hypothetical protein